MQRISQARAQFWRTADKQISQKARMNGVQSKQETTADIRLIKGETFCDHRSYSDPIFWTQVDPICGVWIDNHRSIKIFSPF